MTVTNPNWIGYKILSWLCASGMTVASFLLWRASYNREAVVVASITLIIVNILILDFKIPSFFMFLAIASVILITTRYLWNAPVKINGFNHMIHAFSTMSFTVTLGSYVNQKFANQPYHKPALLVLMLISLAITIGVGREAIEFAYSAFIRQPATETATDLLEALSFDLFGGLFAALMILLFQPRLEVNLTDLKVKMK